MVCMHKEVMIVLATALAAAGFIVIPFAAAQDCSGPMPAQPGVSCNYEDGNGYMMCNANICKAGTYCDSFDHCLALYNQCQQFEGAACTVGSSFPWTLNCNGQPTTVSVTRYNMQIPGVGTIECDFVVKPMVWGNGNGNNNGGRKLLSS